jgi:hypothetical protein
MKGIITLLLTSLLPFALCLPQLRPRDFSFEQFSFGFYGGPDSYTLNFPADGQQHPTSSSPALAFPPTATSFFIFRFPSPPMHVYTCLYINN